MNIIRWEPLPSLLGLRGGRDRFFEESFGPPMWRFHHNGGSVPLDVYTTENEMVVTATLPGMKPEEVDINIEGELLTIKGELKADEGPATGDYLYHERRHGAFSRSLTLPSGLRTDQAEAVFENGILTLTIPKAEELKPRKIEVKAKKLIESKK